MRGWSHLSGYFGIQRFKKNLQVCNLLKDSDKCFNIYTMHRPLVIKPYNKQCFNVKITTCWTLKVQNILHQLVLKQLNVLLFYTFLIKCSHEASRHMKKVTVILSNLKQTYIWSQLDRCSSLYHLHFSSVYVVSRNRLKLRGIRCLLCNPQSDEKIDISFICVCCARRWKLQTEQHPHTSQTLQQSQLLSERIITQLHFIFIGLWSKFQLRVLVFCLTTWTHLMI